MFDKSYHYRQINYRKENDNLVIFLFRFKPDEDRTIIVEVEYYQDHPIGIIKFYPKHLRNSKNRFKNLAGGGKLAPILRTCVEIMLSLYRENPYISFGFCGTPSPKEIERNNTENSQRYRIYRYLMANFFSNIKFQHLAVDHSNLYFLINRDYCDANPLNQILLLKQVKATYPNELLWEDTSAQDIMGRR